MPRPKQARRLAVESLEARVQPAALNIALVSDAVVQAEQVQAAVGKGVTAITYESANASLGGLIDVLESVSAANGNAKIGHLGLVAHGRSGAINLGAFENLDSEDTSNQTAEWARLRGLLTPNSRLDLFACDVAADRAGKVFVKALARVTGADVYASTDAVGTVRGADFVWEFNTGVRGMSPLFSMAALRKVKGLKLEDAYFPNQTKPDADRVTGTNSPNLGVLTGNKTVSNLQLIAGAPDWYRFDTDGIATTANNVRIEFNNDNGNLDLYVYEQDGSSLVTGYGSASNGNFEQIELAGKPAGTYYIAVYGRTDSVGNPNYTLQVLAPPAAGDDAYEFNDGKADADRPTGANSPNLGMLTSVKTLSDLVLDGESDWFKFQTDGIGTTADHVRLDFENENGNIDLYVYEQDGSSLVTGYGSASNGDFEQIELAGKPAGTYYIQVYPRLGSLSGNPKYSLQIKPPAAAGDDPFEGNDGKSDADRAVGTNSPNLGVVAGSRVLSNLVLDGESDWFRFETTQASTGGNYVRLDFDNDQGNIDLYVYEQDGSTLVTGYGSASNGDFEQIDLATYPTGTYYVQIYPRLGSRSGNPNYTLQVLAPGSGLSVESVSVTEGDSGFVNANFTVTRGNGAGSASVQIATADGTAEAGTDYIAIPAMTPLNFANGETTKTVTVQVKGDVLDEPDETFYLNLSNAVGAILNTSQAVCTILNDDSAGSLHFSSPSYSISESAGTAFIKVTRVGGSEGQVTVQYALEDGSAVAMDDYVDTPATTGTITFNNGEVSKTISVPIVNDGDSESDETVNLILSDPTGGAILGDQSNAELTILANDRNAGKFQFSLAQYSANENSGSLTIEVQRVGGSDGAVSVKYSTFNKTALAGSDYTADTDVLNFQDGETTQSFDIEILNDSVYEALEYLNVSLSTPTGGAKLGAPRTAKLHILSDDNLMTSGTIVAGEGKSGVVKVVDGATGLLKATIQAFPVAYKKGVRVATGDVNGDGVSDIIAAGGPSGSNTVLVFSGVNGDKLPGVLGEFAHGFNFTSGIQVAVGDLDGDNKAEIIVTAPGAGGGPHVKVFDGATRSLSSEFDAFAGSTQVASVAVGDVLGTTAKEIVVAIGGTTSAPGKVKVYSATGSELSTINLPAATMGGISVATGDVSGDDKADIIVGSGPGAGPHVKVFSGLTGLEIHSVPAPYAASYRGGVRVAVGDVNGDGINELITAGGLAPAQKVKVINFGTGVAIRSLSPFGTNKVDTWIAIVE